MYTPPEEETKRKETEKKNPLAKIGDGDPHFEVLGALVRLGVLVWSGAILTLTYVQVPGLPQQKIDPTFIASVFTGALATFGVQSQKRDSTKPEPKKEDAKSN